MFVAGLVLWAFWPSNKPKHTAQPQDAAADDHDDDPHEDQSPDDDSPRVLADLFSGVKQ
jgi:hypothetical protein